MELSRSKRDSQIVELAMQIVALCQEVTTTTKSGGVSVDPAKTPEEIAEAVKKRVCLNCGKPLKGRGPERRGLDTGCYYEVKRLVDDKKLTDAQAVTAGLWLAKTKGGRPRATEREGSAAEQYMRRLHEVEITSTAAQGVSKNHAPK